MPRTNEAADTDPCLIPLLTTTGAGSAGTGLHMELFTLPLDTNGLKKVCENR